MSDISLDLGKNSFTVYKGSKTLCKVAVLNWDLYQFTKGKQRREISRDSLFSELKKLGFSTTEAKNTLESY